MMCIIDLCGCVCECENAIDILGGLANAVTIVGGITILFAFQEYNSKILKEKRNSADVKLHAIRAIKAEIERIAFWTSLEQGGYKKSESKDWKQKEISRAHSGSITYQIENSFLLNLSILPGFMSLGEDINEKVSWVNQWVLSFNNQVEEIRIFRGTILFEQYCNIDDKIANGGLSVMEPVERKFVMNLMDKIFRLHFKIIGDETTKSLYFWHKELTRSLGVIEKETKDEITKLNEKKSFFRRFWRQWGL